MVGRGHNMPLPKCYIIAYLHTSICACVCCKHIQFNFIVKLIPVLPVIYHLFCRHIPQHSLEIPVKYAVKQAAAKRFAVKKSTRFTGNFHYRWQLPANAGNFQGHFFIPWENAKHNLVPTYN